LSGFEIDITPHNENWRTLLPDPEYLIRQAVRAANQEFPAGLFAEISLALVDDVQMQTLNHQYRGQNKPTNVLSFPGMDVDGFKPLLGDIVLAYESILRESDKRDIQVRDHVTHLVIHGYLHLQGYNHEQEKDAARMENLEIRALKRLGIENPYDKGDVL